MSTKTVGIIGAGNIGRAVAQAALLAGRQVVLSNSRGPESLESVAAALGDGARTGTVTEAAAAPVVVLAVPWDQVEDALSGLTWDGQVVIDATNAIAVTFDDGVPNVTVADLGGRVSSEIVAGLVPGARVVKAANTLPAERLGENPRQDGGRRVIVLSGDVADAKAVVGALFEDAGFSTVDLGELSGGGLLQQVPGGALAGRTLVEVGDAAAAGE